MNGVLISKVEDIRDKTIKDASIVGQMFGYDQRIDIRVTSFNKLINLLMGLHIAFLFVENRPDDDAEDFWNPIRSQFIHDVENIQPISFLVSYERFLKTGFVSSLHFIYESTLRVYSLLLDWKWHCNDNKRRWTNQGIYQIYNHLFNEILSMNSGSIRFSDPYKMLSNLKNSLHNNGIHHDLVFTKEKAKAVRYRGESYLFEPSKRVDFVTWELVLNLADDMRGILFQLSKHQRITEINGTIIDPSRERPN